MSRLVVSIGKFHRVAANPVPALALRQQVRFSSREKAPFFATATFGWIMAALSTIAAFAMAGALWKLLHFPH